MKVSQVLHAMGKDATVQIFDSTVPIGKDVLYEGEVRGVKRDSPLNRLHVCTLMAMDYMLVIDVAQERAPRRERKRGNCE